MLKVHSVQRTKHLKEDLKRYCPDLSIFDLSGIADKLGEHVRDCETKSLTESNFDVRMTRELERVLLPNSAAFAGMISCVHCFSVFVAVLGHLCAWLCDSGSCMVNEPACRQQPLKSHISATAVPDQMVAAVVPTRGQTGRGGVVLPATVVEFKQKQNRSVADEYTRIHDACQAVPTLQGTLSLAALRIAQELLSLDKDSEPWEREFLNVPPAVDTPPPGVQAAVLVPVCTPSHYCFLSDGAQHATASYGLESYRMLRESLARYREALLLSAKASKMSLARATVDGRVVALPCVRACSDSGIYRRKTLLMAKRSLLCRMACAHTLTDALEQCVVGLVVLHDYMSVFIMRFDPTVGEFVYADVVSLVYLRDGPATTAALLKLRIAAGESLSALRKLPLNTIDENALGRWKGLLLVAGALSLHEVMVRRARDLDRVSDDDDDDDDKPAVGRGLCSVVTRNDAELSQLVSLALPGSTVVDVVGRVRL
jgi:hypothetical protein